MLTRNTRAVLSQVCGVSIIFPSKLGLAAWLVSRLVGQSSNFSLAMIIHSVKCPKHKKPVALFRLFFQLP